MPSVTHAPGPGPEPRSEGGDLPLRASGGPFAPPPTVPDPPPAPPTPPPPSPAPTAFLPPPPASPLAPFQTEAVGASPTVAGPPPPPLPPVAPGASAPTWRDTPRLPSVPPTYVPPSGGDLPPLPPLPVPAGSTAVAPPAPGRRSWLVALVAGLAAALLTAAVFTSVGRSDDDATASSPPTSGEPLDIQAVLTKAQPSVVTIQTGTPDAIYGGAGTGVIISDDGDVLTNAHVVSGEGSVQVRLFDGRELTADLVGSFPDADIALVRIRDAVGLTPAELGSSVDARVGDEVLAIGNALNLGGLPSVTEGIISAKDRVIPMSEITVSSLLQTDAAINPGNSGGPLVNARGQVIGINTAIISGAQNIGFAIPIDEIKPLVDQLRQGQGALTPDDAFLGVVTVPVDTLGPDELDEYGISASRGAVVLEITPGTAAEAAELQYGDVVVAVDGVPVDEPSDLTGAIGGYRPGDQITLQIERDGRKRDVTVQLGARGGD
jgi:S1-C subfamily serine protease